MFCCERDCELISFLVDPKYESINENDKKKMKIGQELRLWLPITYAMNVLETEYLFH